MTMPAASGQTPRRGLAALATEYSDLLKIVFVFVAAVWALCEYRGKQRDIKIERVIEYTKRASTAEFLAAELKLTEYWTNPETLKKLQALPQGDKPKFAEFIVETVETSLKSEVWKMYRFYDSLATCVNVGLCEQRAACDSFRQDLTIFVANYGPYFDKHRAAYSHDALAPIRAMLARTACANAHR